MAMLKLTPAQYRVLSDLDHSALDAFGQAVFKVQQRVLDVLLGADYAKWYPRIGMYRITHRGRVALIEQKKGRRR